jgi:hypothetical protein
MELYSLSPGSHRSLDDLIRGERPLTPTLSP